LGDSESSISKEASLEDLDVDLTAKSEENVAGNVNNWSGME